MCASSLCRHRHELVGFGRSRILSEASRFFYADQPQLVSGYLVLPAVRIWPACLCHRTQPANWLDEKSPSPRSLVQPDHVRSIRPDQHGDGQGLAVGRDGSGSRVGLPPCHCGQLHRIPGWHLVEDNRLSPNEEPGNKADL